jgi:hypothetical protein
MPKGPQEADPQRMDDTVHQRRIFQIRSLLYLFVARRRDALLIGAGQCGDDYGHSSARSHVADQERRFLGGGE